MPVNQAKAVPRDSQHSLNLVSFSGALQSNGWLVGRGDRFNIDIPIFLGDEAICNGQCKVENNKDNCEDAQLGEN